MRSLVTGVTGQDGWYLAELLQARGDEVVGLVASSDPAPLPPGVTPIAGDMRDAASLRAAVDSCEPDEVYNLASISSVAQSWRDPALVADVNGVGVVRLLVALREYTERTDRGSGSSRRAARRSSGTRPPHRTRPRR